VSGQRASERTREHRLARSATGQSLTVFRVASTLHRDLRGNTLDVVEIVRRELDGNRADVLLQALQPPGAAVCLTSTVGYAASWSNPI